MSDIRIGWSLNHYDVTVALLPPELADGAALRSALEQCMFFGASVGRVGADFRPLIVPVFEDVVVANTLGQWERAADEFKTTLTAHCGVAVASLSAGSASSAAHLLPLFTPGYADSDRTAAPPALRGSRDGDTGAHDAGVLLSDAAAAAAAAHEPLALAPPPSALRYPPLARLLNGALVALNQARRDDDSVPHPDRAS